VERIWPAIPDLKQRRSGRVTDVAYYFFNATVTKSATAISVGAIVLLGARVIGQSMSADDLRALTSR
jgi:hypothetical protein